MRKVVLTMQTTLDGRIAHADGSFWEPFAWGEPEQGYLNHYFRAADTWAMSRVLYEAVVPFWDAVVLGQPPDDAGELGPADLEFAELQHGLHKVVFSTTMTGTDGATVIHGDLAPQLQAMKTGPGPDILLSAGPATLAPLWAQTGLVDELVVPVHPAVIADGPRLFDGVPADLALTLAEAQTFASGCIVLHYLVG